MSFKKGETRLSEILQQLAAMPPGEIGEWQKESQASRAASRLPTTGQEDPFWPTGLESPALMLRSGGPGGSYRHRDPHVLDAIAKVTLYLQVQRDLYYPTGQPLGELSKGELQGFFSPALLNQVRIVELKGRRVQNPWFYNEARAKGIQNLPDIAHKAAVTFLDVIVFNQQISERDLFHGLVHAAQVKILGIERFAERFVIGFLQARSYFLVPLKAHAFALDTRYSENPQSRFPVEEEIQRWDEQDRY